MYIVSYTPSPVLGGIFSLSPVSEDRFKFHNSLALLFDTLLRVGLLWKGLSIIVV